MFISEFLGDTNFGLASFTLLIYLTIVYIAKKTILQYGTETCRLGLSHSFEKSNQVMNRSIFIFFDGEATEINKEIESAIDV